MLTLTLICLGIGLVTVVPIMIAFEVTARRRGGKPTSGRLDH
jgi:hypothetical protein